jgi:hypothetical protein
MVRDWCHEGFSGASSASTYVRRFVGSQCAYHWSVVVGFACPSCAATYVIGAFWAWSSDANVCLRS